MIARPSLASLLLRTFCNDKVVDQATGFLVKVAGQLFLVTNGHILSGRARVDGRNIYAPYGPWPEVVEVTHLRPDDECERMRTSWNVRNDSGPLWLEHPTHGRLVDVAVLPLGNADADSHVCHILEGQDPPITAWVASGVSVGGLGPNPRSRAQRRLPSPPQFHLSVAGQLNGLFGFQRGVMVASRFQLGLPA